MTNERDDRPTLPDDAKRFVEQFAEHYAPRPMTPARRAAFDAALRERLERRTGRLAWLWAPAALATVAAAAWLWVVLPETSIPRPTETARLDTTSSWELVIYGDLEGDDVVDTELELLGDNGSLPPEYAAIDSVLFGDEAPLGG